MLKVSKQCKNLLKIYNKIRSFKDLKIYLSIKELINVLPVPVTHVHGKRLLHFPYSLKLLNCLQILNLKIL